MPTTEGRNDLLDAIRRGSQLRSVNASRENTRTVIAPHNQELGIADALRLAVIARSQAFHGRDDPESDEDDRTYFTRDAWT